MTAELAVARFAARLPYAIARDLAAFAADLAGQLATRRRAT